MDIHRKHRGGLRWENVSLKRYKDEGHPFAGVTRQKLFGEMEDEAPCEARYFEIEPGGYSSLEKHEHPHAVMVLRGRGQALVVPEVVDVAPFDLIQVPPWIWHQFYAAPDEPMGFLCLVDHERDRPVYPTDRELEELRQMDQVEKRIRV